MNVRVNGSLSLWTCDELATCAGATLPSPNDSWEKLELTPSDLELRNKVCVIHPASFSFVFSFCFAVLCFLCLVCLPIINTDNWQMIDR